VSEVAAQLVAANVQPPSERCARLAQPRAHNVAQARRTTPSGLARKLRGDLDAIALKALERDRTRRYSTPLELAADLRAWLAGEPVSAVEPSALYRFGKLVRRRLAYAVLVGLALVATTGGLAYGWFQAARARDAETARRARLQSALERAFARADLLQIALLVDDPDKPLRELLEPAEKAIQGRYRDDPLVESAVRTALGSTWLDLGDSERARQQLERAWDLIADEPDADDMERFLVLDALLRSMRSGGERVGPELSARCLELSLRLLQDDHPELCAALRHLVERTQSASTSSAELTTELDRDAQVVPRAALTSAQAALVTRALSETAVALFHAGRTAESEQLSSKLEAVARRTLDPESSAWLYFLWRFAAVHQLAGAPLEQRTRELAQQLLDACRKRGLQDEHWLVREAKELGAADAGGASEGAGH
jgi:hypothetical protein